MDFLDELESRIIPADGAMGTELIAANIPAETCFEELCVSQPDLVCDIHDRYLAAGARLIETNTFGANAVRLARHGLEHRVNEINWSAAQLAKQCVRGKNAYVAGSVGPLGIDAAQAGERGLDRAAIFREQLGALLDGGVNLIIFETFTDLEELALALYVKQSLHHCPAVCSVVCDENGALPSGISLADAFTKLRALDAEVVGVNCVESATMTRVFNNVPDDGLRAAFANAGNPKSRDARLVHDTTPDDFAQSARSLANRGVRLIGGCCGTGPRHIAAMVAALENVMPNGD